MVYTQLSLALPIDTLANLLISLGIKPPSIDTGLHRTLFSSSAFDHTYLIKSGQIRPRHALSKNRTILQPLRLSII